MDKPTKSPPSAWRKHWQDECDAAHLYLCLAQYEADESKQEIYEQLAEVERRHTMVWRGLIAEQGFRVLDPKPSVRVRVLAWIAGRIGSAWLLSLLLREEGQEVKGYLSLYRESAPSRLKEVSLSLARESAEHAYTLAGLAKFEGEPWHQTASGGFLRNVIYGFNDGLTANLGLVAGVVGASVESSMVLLTGLAGTVADALSMGASGYLAAKSEQEVYTHEIAVERDEIELMPEVEEQELALLYQARGIDKETSLRIAAEIIASPEKALEEMVRGELGITEPHTTPIREGWITGTATAVGAFIPVAPFLVLTGIQAIVASFTVSMISHFAVGAARSLFTGRGIFRSGFDMFVVGLGVAIVGYFVGDLMVGWLL